MLGLIDTVASLALAGAVVPGTTVAARAGLGVVAFGAVAAGVLILALPRLAATGPALRSRLRRLQPCTTPLHASSRALALVACGWLVRAVGVFLLLDAPGIGFSLPRALLFVCAGCSGGGAAGRSRGCGNQIGGAAASLVAAGIGTASAFRAALSMSALAGTFVLLLAVAWTSTAALAGRRSPA